MKRRTVFAVVVTAMLTVSAWAQTADEIVAKNIEAKGGMDKLKAVQSMRITGKMAVGPGMEAPFTLQKKRPGMLRVDFTLQGMTGTQAYDGTNGWAVMPFLGKKDPEKMNEDQLKDMVEQADFDGPLVNYKDKGNKVEFLGKEDVQGTPAYKLKLTMKNGDESILYLDADAYLELKEESKRKMQGQEIEVETSYGDYKDEGGVMMPHSFTSQRKGGQGPSQTITVEKVETNPTIENTVFTMPEVKKPEEKKPEDKKPN